MAIRPEVVALAAWAPLPPEEDWEPSRIDGLAAAIDAVQAPITADERDLLLPMFERPHDDSVWGAAWGVLHLLETAPSDGWQKRLTTQGNPWYELLAMRWDGYSVSLNANSST